MRDNRRTATRTDWNVAPLPEQRAEPAVEPIQKRYSATDMERLRRGFIPEAMENKWFIFAEATTLSIHRSWTGFCIYEVIFTQEGPDYRISRLLVNRDPAQYTSTDGAYDASLVLNLIDSLLT